MSGLTPRDEKVLTYLRRSVTSTHCPSFAEIEAACGFSSKSQVAGALRRLEGMGHIRKQPDTIRGIELTDPFSHQSTDELIAMRDRIDRVLAGRAQ